MHHYNLYQQNNTLVLVLALDFRKVTIPKTSLSSFSDVCQLNPVKMRQRTSKHWVLLSAVPGAAAGPSCFPYRSRPWGTHGWDVRKPTEQRLPPLTLQVHFYAHVKKDKEMWYFLEHDCFDNRVFLNVPLFLQTFM